MRDHSAGFSYWKLKFFKARLNISSQSIGSGGFRLVATREYANKPE